MAAAAAAATTTVARRNLRVEGWWMCNWVVERLRGKAMVKRTFRYILIAREKFTTTVRNITATRSTDETAAATTTTTKSPRVVGAGGERTSALFGARIKIIRERLRRRSPPSSSSADGSNRLACGVTELYRARRCLRRP